MSSSGYARWELFVGIVGVLTAIPVLVHLFISQLPSRKLPGLFKTLEEADAVFEDSIEEGLLKEHHITEFRALLGGLHSRANEVRAQVHAARDCLEDIVNWAKGLTSKINQLNDDVKEVRADISTTSTREREERERAEIARRVAAGCGAEVEGGTSPHDCNARPTRLHARIWRYTKAMLRRMVSSWLSRTPPRTPDEGQWMRSSPDHHFPLPPDPEASSSSSQTPCNVAPPCSGEAHVAPTACGRNRDSAISAHPPMPGSSLPHAPHRKKRLGSLCMARARALLWSLHRSRRRGSQSKSSIAGDLMVISLTELSSIEPIEEDDDEWEDLTTMKVQLVL
ncbi:hypothetical protein OH77DRAFT_1428998 [Trametes cingulata]|nr:hypothetical protein OH77DRAFT_1428998 [Trametes cingulata]